MEWQELDDVLNIVLKKLQRSLEGHDVHLEIPSDLGLLQADFRLLDHALSNIILNSTQYAGPDCQIWIKAFSDKKDIYIHIEDDGRGVPNNELLHLFEKFYRVPGTAPGGTGLGLSIVKSIIELHGGSIRAENRSPQGVRFVITLPLKPQPSLPQEQP